MESRELPPLTRRLVERVKNMRPEAQIRLEYYLAHLHCSLDHEVHLQVWPAEDPNADPAILSLRARGPIKSSSAVSLSDLAMELQPDTTEEEIRQPLIVFTSSEGEEPEENARDVSPQLQHDSEPPLSPELAVLSENVKREGEVSSCPTTCSEGRMRSRKRHSRKQRDVLASSYPVTRLHG